MRSPLRTQSSVEQQKQLHRGSFPAASSQRTSTSRMMSPQFVLSSSSLGKDEQSNMVDTCPPRQSNFAVQVLRRTMMMTQKPLQKKTKKILQIQRLDRTFRSVPTKSARSEALVRQQGHHPPHSPAAQRHRPSSRRSFLQCGEVVSSTTPALEHRRRSGARSLRSMKARTVTVVSTRI